MLRLREAGSAQRSELDRDPVEDGVARERVEQRLIREDV